MPSATVVRLASSRRICRLGVALCRLRPLPVCDSHSRVLTTASAGVFVVALASLAWWLEEGAISTWPKAASVVGYWSPKPSSSFLSSGGVAVFGMMVHSNSCVLLAVKRISTIQAATTFIISGRCNVSGIAVLPPVTPGKDLVRVVLASMPATTAAL